VTFIDRLPGYVPVLIDGAEYTLIVSAISLVIGSAIGMLVAAGALSGHRLVRWVVRVYVEVGRAIPEIVQIYIWYYLLPTFGLVLPALAAGIVALSVAFGPFLGEVFRAGVSGVERTQWEAAQVLGMRPVTKWRRIIIPQAVRIILPVLTGYFISMFKATSLLSFIAIPELFGAAKAAANINFQYFELFGLVLLVYMAMGYPTVWVMRQIERRLRVGVDRVELSNVLQATDAAL
jgi:polar amino acid transport system permease protein